MHTILPNLGLAAMITGLLCEVKGHRVPRDTKDQSEYLKWTGIGGVLLLGGFALLMLT